jgi:RNA:NAD 2'-phosphotransferase (TPT1/KptA family)
MTAKQRITINMTEAEYADLSALAERFQVSMAWLGRRALGEMVEKYKHAGQLTMPFDTQSPKEKA